MLDGNLAPATLEAEIVRNTRALKFTRNLLDFLLEVGEDAIHVVRLDAELAQDVLHMDLDGGLGNAELPSNDLIGVAPSNQLESLPLARRQSRKRVRRWRCSRLAGRLGLVALAHADAQRTRGGVKPAPGTAGAWTVQTALQHGVYCFGSG